MKKAGSNKDTSSFSLQAFFDLLEKMDGFGVSSIGYEDFKTNREVINYNMDLYDTFHGKDGWNYNLLTGKLERIGNTNK